MITSRRDFIGSLLCASGALVAGCRTAQLAHKPIVARHTAPLITSYNDNGQPELVEGKTLLISLISPSAMAQPEGSFPLAFEPESIGGEQLIEPQPLFFYPDADSHIIRTILSAPLDVIAGLRPLLFTAPEKSSEKAELSPPFSVRRGFYREATLTLDKNFSSPTPEITRQQQQDFAEMVEILKLRTERHWSKSFLMPTDKGDIDNFGDRRTVNGTKRYRHRGLDLHAPMGTPVQAVNDGIAVLSGEQWTAGQTICIDHGGGIFSKYAHLSEKRVSKGEKVTRGQVIALSGNSGGQKPPPHLHLDIIINGTHVDPKDFMRTAEQLVQVEAAGKHLLPGERS
jgi:murein DD-endopeptidase MepM/ murein hydrolase activator NlpD